MLQFKDCGLLLSPSSLSTDLLPNPNLNNHHRFLRQLLLPLIAGVWVVCQHLISFAGGVQSFQDTVKGAQQLAAKCIYAGMYLRYFHLNIYVLMTYIFSQIIMINFHPLNFNILYLQILLIDL